MNQSKLYVAAVNAAANCIGKSKDEISLEKQKSFTALGLELESDWALFSSWFDNQLAIISGHDRNKIPSITSSKKVSFAENNQPE